MEKMHLDARVASLKAKAQAHWHEHNPWGVRAIYLPDHLEAAAAVDPRNAQETLKRWQTYSDKIDVYLLRKAYGPYPSLGVRYGKDGPDYLSPFCHPKLAELLLFKYGA